MGPEETKRVIEAFIACLDRGAVSDLSKAETA